MAFKGENIDFVIKGDDKVNLDGYDFVLLAYPDGKYDKYTEIKKSDMTKISENHYEGSILPDVSKTMAVGSYTIEILLMESDTRRSIFVKRGAFPLYDSASKNLE